MESKGLIQMRKRIVKDFLDMMILTEMQKHSVSGYDVINLIHKKFDMLLSSGTVYSYLYLLERKGLIRAEWSERRRVYELTETGKETVAKFLNSKNKILGIVSNLFDGA